MAWNISAWLIISETLFDPLLPVFKSTTNSCLQFFAIVGGHCTDGCTIIHWSMEIQLSLPFYSSMFCRKSAVELFQSLVSIDSDAAGCQLATIVFAAIMWKSSIMWRCNEISCLVIKTEIYNLLFPPSLLLQRLLMKWPYYLIGSTGDHCHRREPGNRSRIPAPLTVHPQPALRGQQVPTSLPISIKAVHYVHR